MTARSIALFVAAAIAEIGGAYLVWLGIKEHRGALFVAAGMLALALYGMLAAFQPSHEFGRVLAAYGGIFIVGSLRRGGSGLTACPAAPHPQQRLPPLLWGVVFDDFEPDRADIAGALVCLTGVGIIMYAR